MAEINFPVPPARPAHCVKADNNRANKPQKHKGELYPYTLGRWAGVFGKSLLGLALPRRPP